MGQLIFLAFAVFAVSLFVALAVAVMIPDEWVDEEPPMLV